MTSRLASFHWIGRFLVLLALTLGLYSPQPASAEPDINVTHERRISNLASVDGPVYDFQLDVTGKYAVYKTFAVDSSGTTGIANLHSVLIAGGSPVILNTPFPAVHSYDLDYKILPDGSRVVYRTYQESTTYTSLYVIPIQGGTPKRISKVGENVTDYKISPDGKWAVFLAQDASYKVHVYRVSMTSSTYPTEEITFPTATNLFLASLKISPDSQHLIFLGMYTGTPDWGIYSLPITGTGSQAVKISREFTGNFLIQFEVTPDSTKVLYLNISGTGSPWVYQLYMVPIAGSDSDNTALGGIIPSGGGFGRFQISPDSKWVVFTANKDNLNQLEMYSTTLNTLIGPIKRLIIKLNVLLPGDNAVSDQNFVISPDSTRVVYNAYQNNRHDLFSVPINGPNTANVKLNHPIDPSFNFGWSDQYYFTGDSSQVVYTSMQDTPDLIDLYSVPSAGPASDSVQINPLMAKNTSNYNMVRSVQIPTFGGIALFIADPVTGSSVIYRTPISGPATSSQALTSLVPNFLANSMNIANQTGWAVYRRYSSGLDIELYAVQYRANVFLPVIVK